MCKGLPAIFPLAFLPLRYLLLRDVPLKKIIFYTVIVLLMPAAIYFLILAFDAGAVNSLQFYVEKRLLNRLENDPTVENRFTILFWLLTDLLVPVALFFILGLIFKFRSFAEGAKNRYRPALFFLLYGLCGVAPLAITHVQRATYFVPALPFIALGSALLIIDRISEIIGSMNLRAVKTVRAVVVCLFVFCAILCVALAGKTGRDGKLLSDTHKIGAVTGKGISIGTSFEIYSKWDLQFYLLRYYNCALFVTRDSTERYLLLNSPADPFLKGYSAPVNLTGYTLFSKKNK
jgi:hypothetical protein